MGQRVIHREPGCDTPFILAFCPAEQVKVTAFAHSQHNKLYILAHNITDDIINKIQPFLIAQTANHSDNRGIRIHIQSQFFLKGFFACCFS